MFAESGKRLINQLTVLGYVVSCSYLKH